MRRYLSLLLGILGFVPICAQKSDFYYYNKGNRIDLTVDSTHLFVVSEGKLQLQNTARTRAMEYDVSCSSRSYVYKNVVPIQKRRSITPEVYFSTLEIPDDVTVSQYDALVERIKAEENIWQVLPSFTSNGKTINISNNFYVKLKSSDDLGKLQQLALQYGVEIVGNNEFAPLWYTLSCNSTSSNNAIECANLFYLTNLFECSEPEFVFSKVLYSDDEIYPQQWNLKHTELHKGLVDIDINIEEAWETTKGDGVVVAVIDQGIYKYHPDLEANMHSKSYDALTNTSPSVIADNIGYAHGTACAGIIGAIQDNGIGISGIAPEVELMDISLDLTEGGFTSQQIANAFYWAKREEADVISCSWGWQNTTPDLENIEFINEAIDHVLDNGRNGKGCIIVCSAGNEGNAQISYPANCDSRIITVGGINPWGKRTIAGKMEDEEYFVDFSSNYGDNLDVVAPSVLVPSTSISRLFNGGYTSSYTEAFKGTSSACPHVSGIVALMLSVNPDLTVEEVEFILGRTARKIRTDVYSYQKDASHINNAWNNEVGYGLVDATAAVEMAERAAVTTYVRNQVLDCDIDYSNYNVELENVTIEPNVFIEIGKENEAILKSSVKIMKGGSLIIYNGVLW